MREMDLLKYILATVPKTGLWYRRNVGQAIDPNTGRMIRFGTKGQADIAGIIDGRAVEIEVKSPQGKQSQEQKNWQKAVEKAGGVYILARSVDDVRSRLMEENLWQSTSKASTKRR